MTQRIGFRISDDHAAEIDRLATGCGMSTSAVGRAILTSALDNVNADIVGDWLAAERKTLADAAAARGRHLAAKRWSTYVKSSTQA